MQKLKRMVPLAAILALGFLSSCSTVKGHQKMYLNDPCMVLEANKLDFFETNFQTYREGASGANGGKVGEVVDAISNDHFPDDFSDDLSGSKGAGQ